MKSRRLDCWRRWFARSERPGDVALAVAAAGLNVVGALVPDATVAYAYSDRHTSALVLVCVLSGFAYLWRREHPLEVMLCQVAVLAIVHLAHWPTGMLPLTLLVAAYALGAWGSARDCALGLGAMYVLMATLAALRTPFFDSWFALSIPVTSTLPVFLGLAVRRRRRAAEEAIRRQAQLERTRAMRAEQAVIAERLSLARELHDVVTHTLSAIVVQAGSARYRLGPATGPVAGALSAIERSSRTALDDLRRMLGVLRDGADGLPAVRPVRAAAQASDPVLPRTLAGDRATDIALGITAAILNVSGTLLADPSSAEDLADPHVAWLGVLAVTCGLALIWRRRCPVTVLVICLMTVVVVQALDWQSGTMPGCLLFAVYAVGAWAPLGRGVAGLVVFQAALAGADALAADDRPILDGWSPGSVVFFTVPWIVGAAIQAKRHEAEHAVARALETERAGAQEAERAAAAERMRLARELHDVIAHTLSAITVQSAVARHLLTTEEGSIAGEALSAVERSSRGAMQDLRQMLDVLQGEDPPALTPSPGLDDLELLAAAHRAAHGPVELQVDPAVLSAPASLRLTAYRLVQESLTNIAKHSSGSSARVSVRATDSGVVVDVVDDGTGCQITGLPRSPGYGIRGMRERVAMFDGLLDSGPLPGGGYRVLAELRRGAGS